MKSPITKFTIHGNSMLPTLSPGQDVLSFNWAYIGKKPKVGDIVVVEVNGRQMVKRIQKVDDRHIFVVGDNDKESTDSRDFGPISEDQIIGRVVYKSDVILGTSGARTPESRSWTSQDDKMVDCPQCGSEVLGIYGRKDAICKNCGFKLTCCGEP